MKKKTIRLVINNKIDDWIKSIDDPAIQTMVKKNTIVTGGCIASMLLKEKVNDFDVYFRDKTTTKLVAEYYLKKFKENTKVLSLVNTNMYVDAQDDRVSIYVKSAGVATENSDKSSYFYFEMMPDYEAENYTHKVVGEIEDTYDETNEQAQEVEDNSYRPVFLSTNAITLSNRIQIITRFFGDPEEIHKNFDYVHCTNYWKSWDNELILKQDALEAILARELRYVGSKYPLCSILRMRKFIQRGWTINAGQILKAVMQLQELDLNDIDVLRDQLTGVDSAYFTQVIKRLKEKGAEKIDSAYLIEIIDRIF